MDKFNDHIPTASGPTHAGFLRFAKKSSLLCGNTLRARSYVHNIISLYDFIKGFSASPIQYLFSKKNLEGY